MNEAEVKAFYESNQDFKEYVTRVLRDYPEKTLDEILKHKGVISVAEYYKDQESRYKEN